MTSAFQARQPAQLAGLGGSVSKQNLDRSYTPRLASARGFFRERFFQKGSSSSTLCRGAPGPDTQKTELPPFASSPIGPGAQFFSGGVIE